MGEGGSQRLTDEEFDNASLTEKIFFIKKCTVQYPQPSPAGEGGPQCISIRFVFALSAVDEEFDNASLTEKIFFIKKCTVQYRFFCAIIRTEK